MNELETYLKEKRAWIWDAINDPKWETADRVHDWRNHVPSEFRDMWQFLSVEARTMIVVQADQAAGEEAWP